MAEGERVVETGVGAGDYKKYESPKLLVNEVLTLGGVMVCNDVLWCF